MTGPGTSRAVRSAQSSHASSSWRRALLVQRLELSRYFHKLPKRRNELANRRKAAAMGLIILDSWPAHLLKQI